MEKFQKFQFATPGTRSIKECKVCKRITQKSVHTLIDCRHCDGVTHRQCAGKFVFIYLFFFYRVYSNGLTINDLLN